MKNAQITALLLDLANANEDALIYVTAADCLNFGKYLDVKVGIALERQDVLLCPQMDGWLVLAFTTEPEILCGTTERERMVGIGHGFKVKKTQDIAMRLDDLVDDRLFYLDAEDSEKLFGKFLDHKVGQALEQRGVVLCPLQDGWMMFRRSAFPLLPFADLGIALAA